MHLRRFERGELIFWEGDPCAGLHIIRKGSVKLFKTSVHGRELTVSPEESNQQSNKNGFVLWRCEPVQTHFVH
jgi:CRP/FNR family transcriptional regulator